MQQLNQKPHVASHNKHNKMLTRLLVVAMAACAAVVNAQGTVATGTPAPVPGFATQTPGPVGG